MGRRALVAFAAVAGAFAAAGLLLAALFEIQGFGTPRDAGPRAWRVALLALGAAFSAGLPLILWRRLLPASAPAAILVVALPAGLLAVVLLGLSLGA